MAIPLKQQHFFPAIDLEEIQHHFYLNPLYNVKLFSNNRQLLITKREVIIINGVTISKRLIYEEDIITATFTSFSSSPNDECDALVVCFKKEAKIYYQDGRSYVISFPFILRNALPFESGLILEKDQNQQIFSHVDNIHPQQLHNAKFLTLVDPIGTFKIIASSSISVISSHEELLVFPVVGLNKTSSLCATYNSSDRSVILYHIRSSNNRNTETMTKGTKFQKRKQSIISTPNTSRILEDEFENPLNQNVISLNMEKKRTSTLLSDASSMARMGSDSGLSDASKLKISNDFQVLRKDMIFTRMEVFNLNINRQYLAVHSLTYDGQEAIVLVNKKKKEANVYIFRHSSAPRFQSSFKVPCIDCLPLNNVDYRGYLIAMKDENSIFLVNPFLELTSPSITLVSKDQQIACLQSSYGSNLSIKLQSGENRIVKLILGPSSELVMKCLRCFKYLSGSKVNEIVWTMWRTSLMIEGTKNEWNSFVITILAIVYPFDNELPLPDNYFGKLLSQAKTLLSIFDLKYSFEDLIPYIVVSLHLVREEYRLDALSQQKLNKMGHLLTQLTVWMGWPDIWTSYYMIDLKDIDLNERFLLILILSSPPNLLESLTSLFTDKIIRYLTFSQLVEEGESVDEVITPRTHSILKLFEMIVSPHYGPSNVIDMMCDYNITIHDLETYPPAIYLPLKDAILICQENPAFEWTAKTLELVGRKDLSMFLSDEKPSAFNETPNTQVKDINSLLTGVLDKNESISAWDGQSEADRIGITKLIFDYDRRYFEITTLLHQTKTQTATLIADENISEYDFVVLQRELANVVALRTLTIPLGRAALFYGARKPLLTEKYPIPKFNLNTMIAPTMTNIILSDGALSTHVSEWGYFHNGVSSGLSISKESKGISGSWIIFNKPPKLNSQHAGFLLGLGLNGHLKKLEEWHIYNYLGPKHSLTSVGLLLGMAASLRGTMDNKLTKVLSVHAVALLPQGANDLNVSVIVQAAGLIGIGLLYLESQHRRMSEILLSQICSSVYQNDSEQIHEGYRLSAGIALGFVNLGKGNDLRGLNDTRVVDRLLALATSMKDYQPIEELDKSCSGAIIALGFIYLKTGNTSVAKKLIVPATDQLLDYIRPDLLLLRSLCCNLILWDSIGNTVEWIQSQIPISLLEKYDKITFLDSDQLAYFNIVGGICLSVAIKYASSQDIIARDTIIHYLDKIMEVSMMNPSNFDQKIAHRSAKNIQNLLSLCLSVVMTGSGDLETFRRLRALYNDTDKDMNYGNYMAINTALGFLFLGGGQYAFSNSNFAIACLVTSLYPTFPNDSSEYEIHLQALRHFWALSTEPRCLIVRDVTTQSPCKILVTVELKNGKSMEVLTPCLLPNLDEILIIKTNSPNHFDVKIDFHLNSEYLEIFKKSLTIFVYKKRNYNILKSSVSTLLKNENRLHKEIDPISIDSNASIAKLLNMAPFSSSTNIERLLFLSESAESDYSHANLSGMSIFNIIDNKIELYKIARSPSTVDDLWNLKLIFAFTDRRLEEEMNFIDLTFIEHLKYLVSSLVSC